LKKEIDNPNYEVNCRVDDKGDFLLKDENNKAKDAKSQADNDGKLVIRFSWKE